MAKKILIIDDDLGLIEIFKTVLVDANYQIFTAERGGKGMDLAVAEVPDLILLDYMLPDINGIEVLKRLKTQELTKNIPIVILTNFGQENTIKQSLYDGATDFWLKYQIGPQDLVDKVKVILHDNVSS